MSSGIPSLSPLINYGAFPLVVALFLVVIIGAWYFIVFFTTKKKTPVVLKNTPVTTPPLRSIEALRAEYLQKIESLASSYAARAISARAVHQQLSLLLREFVAKANNVPADTMTLSDLKKMNLPTLTPVIESFYIPEFSMVESGSVQAAIATAREVVAQWS